MRLTIFFLTFCFVHAYANSAAQTITFSGKNLTLDQVVTVIEKQTGYVVLSNKDVFSNAKHINITAVKMPLQVFLDAILKDLPIEYEIKGRTIILSPRRGDSFMQKPAPENKPPLTIRVTDADGNPLPGATVSAKNKTMGVTDMQGMLNMNVAEGDVLTVSFIGMETFTIRVTRAVLNNAPLSVTLKPSATKLDDVVLTVNTGYQSISRERMTGSYSIVQTKRLENKLQPGLLTALEGQAAGVVITKDGKLEIRGRSTFFANAEPLVVVDGFPISGGLETVNIDNVESITVLKDAVAASIYGARSSNGVIVITTKTAKRGKVQIGYKGSTGITLRPDLSYLDKPGTADYIDAEMEYYGLNPTGEQTTFDRSITSSRVYQLLIAKDRGQITAAQMNAELDALKQNDGLGQLQEYLFRPKFTQQHNLSFSAGNDKSATNAALRYISNQNNMIRNSDKRVIFDLKNDWKPVSNVTVRLFSNINFSSSTAPARQASEFYAYSSSSVIRPYSMLADPATGQAQNIPATRNVTQFNGVPGLKPMDYNPLNDLSLETTKGQNLQVRLGASISVNILDGLSAEVGGVWTRGSSMTRTIYDVNAFRVRVAYNAATSVSDNTKHYIPNGSIIDEARNINEAYTFRGQINFNRTLNTKHRITAIAGGEINRDVLDNNSYPTRYGYNDQAGSFAPMNYSDFNAGLYSADFLLNSSGVIYPGNGSYAFRDNRFVSMYSNGSYEYDNRFILSGSARIDQTNFFGTNPKYRYKPNWSVGGTYKLANEKFFHVPWIERLNIRGSYGINGNISLKQGPYLLIAAQGYSPTSGGIVYTISSLPNKDLRWERTKIVNIGADLTLFKGRLNATIDYYNKLSIDLFAPDFIDNTYGRGSITRNAGSARNTGIELSLESDLVKTNNFRWNVFFNGSYNQSKVLTFNYNYAFSTALTLSSSASLVGESGGASLRTGYPLDALFAYQFAGLNNTGIATFYTNEKAKVLGGAVKVSDLSYAGTIRPKYVLNLTNSFSYQRFDLSFMLIAQLGSVFRTDTYYGYNYNNKHVSERWRVPGDEEHTIYPKLTNANSAGWYYPYADIMIRSGNYMKLRDLTLSYTLDNKLWGHSGFNNARVYFQGRNLAMVTANKDHIDPETALNEDGSVSRTLPLRPELYIGLSINF